MTESEISIPEKLQPVADAAVQWINSTQGSQFELTGIVDQERSLVEHKSDRFELGLVLCDGEICSRAQVHVSVLDGGYEFSFAEEAVRDIPPLLDPPRGVRETWLDSVLRKHEFVLLLFYRGLW